MKHLFSTDFQEKLNKAKRVLLFLDYDGTLSPLIKDPNKAHMPATIKNRLRELSRKKNIKLAVISGRALSDVRKRVGLKGIAYAGNHGFEVFIAGKNYFTRPLPKGSLSVLRKVKRLLRRGLAGVEGIVFEDKGPFFAIHYRKADTSQISLVKAVFAEVTRPLIKQKKIIATRGKKFLEARPNINCTKADAFRLFEKKFKKTKSDITVFAGDDITDEDIFRVMRSPDIGVRIGRKKTSHAAYFLKNIREVSKLLKVLAKK